MLRPAAHIFISHLNARGVVEHIEFDLTPRCDDGTLKRDSALVQWIGMVHNAMDQVGRSLRINPDTGDALRQAGLTDVTERRIRIPFSSWSPDPHERDLGRWFNLALMHSVQSYGLAQLTRILRKTTSEVKDLLTAVRGELSTLRHHSYCYM
jgi:hypothetical protein